LETGDFHGEEVGAKAGERWLGLLVGPKGSSLRSLTISVAAVHDPIVDDDENQKSGKRVSAAGESQPVFLVKGAVNLQPGSVVTTFRGDRRLGNGARVPLSLQGRRYELRVLSKDPEPKDYLVQNTRLVLVSGRQEQTLIALREHDDAGWTLTWAGDIDGDGKLDLYMDLSNHYNVSRRTLLLSTRAAKGKLVREVATFTTVGC
jgi:hypothetical protein